MVIYSMNQYNTEGLFSCPPVKEGVTALGAACAVKMENVTKRFGKVVANSAINLELHEGEILSLLGENGSGKTTLMNMLSGIYFPDEGQIYIHGEPVTIASPKDAFEHGIGMIHQHFKLVDVFSAAENIILGLEGDKGKLDRSSVRKAVREIADRYGFEIDPDQKIYDMSVSQKQTVEIVKVLYRGADILILDEPTAVLTPQETDKLFAVMRNMKADGKAIIIITHKLHEVLSVSDRVAVLRKGQYIGCVDTAQATQQSLTDMMVGHSVSLNIDRPKNEQLKERLTVSGLTVLDKEGVKKLDNVSFTAMGGEILGIGGLSDCGIHTLGKVLYGLIPPSRGEVRKDAGQRVKSPSWAVRHGMAYVSKNRDTESMMLVCSVKDNICLPSLHDLAAFGPISPKKQKKLAAQWSKRMEVKANSIETYCNTLSGGNKQKVVLAKWLGKGAEILILDCPTRGIDVGTKAAIYQLIEELKAEGRSIVLISEELPELIGMSDRILLLKDGGISGEFFRRDGLTEAKLIEKMI